MHTTFSRQRLRFFFCSFCPAHSQIKHCILKATDWMFHTGRVCQVWCNFWHGYTCQTTIIFGTLKNRSLEINSLPLNNCFIYRNVSQNFRPFDLVHISPACGPNAYQIMYRETSDFQGHNLQWQHGRVLMANLLHK